MLFLVGFELDKYKKNYLNDLYNCCCYSISCCICLCIILIILGLVFK